MDEEQEFERYRRLYHELEERVARLGRFERMTEELQRRMAALTDQVEALAEEAGGVETRPCDGCGTAVYGPGEPARCPRCREAREGA